MNSVHDMGGMHGMGPLLREDHEPVFHEDWERRVWGLSRTIGRWGRGRWGSFRYELERIPAAEYLRMSYYERWFTALVTRLIRSDLIAPAELDAGKADPSRPRPTLPPELDAAQALARTAARRDDVRVNRRFRLGQRVRARNIHPEGHTRLPRYVRGRSGRIVRHNGVFNPQDTGLDGQPLAARPQHVYTVRFAARELWGERASAQDGVYVDLWEDYLERA